MRMHCTRLEEEELEAHELFVALGVLVVEGRVAGASDRGYGEGPHCSALGAKQRVTIPHKCDPESNWLCRRDIEFRKRMLLLWHSGVPMKIEVLLCPDCTCGALRTQCLEPSFRPSPSDLLLEQWTITATRRETSGGPSMGIRGLMQAVRSQLFFSQLGAWMSSSGGRTPRHVCYRLTVAEEAFASHFQRQSVEHSFPAVTMGRPNNKVTFQVSLKSIPRGEGGSPPVLICCRSAHENLEQRENSTNNNTTLANNSAVAAKENTAVSTSSVKRKVSREEEKLDSPLLGESLLDPPQRRDRMCLGSNASRYQSPSQRASPSLESPDHLMFRTRPSVIDGIVPGEGQSGCQNRTGRHGLLRRRDIKREKCVVDDRLLTGCTRPGKHHCCAQDEEPSTSTKQDSAAASTGEAAGKLSSKSLDMQNKSKINLSRREVEEVLAVLKYRTRAVSPPLAKGNDFALPKGPHSLEKLPNAFMEKDITVNTVNPIEMLMKKDAQVSELSSTLEPEENNNNKADRLLQAILRPSVQEQQNKPSGLERLKHLFNKTITVPSPTKDTPSTNATIAATTTAINENLKAQVPSALDKEQFRRSLDSAASMVFRSGLPLTSSPAPVRRGTCFDFDSSLNSVQAIRSALFESQSPVSPLASSCNGEEENSLVSPDIESPHSPLSVRPNSKPSWSPTSGALLGTFEESVLNGRLEPVSTIHGFTAELGASGSFCPKHLHLPVTVFFYTLGDNDKVSTPYLGHINLGKKGYNVPKCGTVQVTLFNPLGTVVKMFVVSYDFSDMPPNSQTFLRQRTVYLPAATPLSNNNSNGMSTEHTNLRYLIHLRFSSSKSGRIYLHSDIRMIIFRKSDQDTANAHAEPNDPSAAYELRSFISGPTTPKYSPRK